jgi:hypothetical protein
MTDAECTTLRIEGEKLLNEIIGDLNKISSQFVRTDPDCYRRMEDYREIAIALALYERKKNAHP